MARAGASQYTFHLEATDDIMGCIEKVKTAKMKVSRKWFIRSFC